MSTYLSLPPEWVSSARHHTLLLGYVSSLYTGSVAPTEECFLTVKGVHSAPVAGQLLPTSMLHLCVCICASSTADTSSLFFQPLRVKNKATQFLRGKNLLISMISACYDTVTPAHTADFSDQKMIWFFLLKIHFHQQETFFKTNIFILSGH